MLKCKRERAKKSEYFHSSIFSSGGPWSRFFFYYLLNRIIIDVASVCPLCPGCLCICSTFPFNEKKKRMLKLRYTQAMRFLHITNAGMGIEWSLGSTVIVAMALEVTYKKQTGFRYSFFVVVRQVRIGYLSLVCDRNWIQREWVICCCLKCEHFKRFWFWLVLTMMMMHCSSGRWWTKVKGFWYFILRLSRIHVIMFISNQSTFLNDITLIFFWIPSPGITSPTGTNTTEKKMLITVKTFTINFSTNL